ncbi:MAG: ECF-type sigma factor [Planctomycetes bacterium]|nr:ECF-type sigma factor [Planctomycetota bacterium]
MDRQPLHTSAAGSAGESSARPLPAAPDAPAAATPDASAATTHDALVALLYDDLRASARRLFRDAERGTELQTTALLHEAWLRLVPESERRFEDPRAFVVAMTKTMRSILVDRARSRARLKRGGNFTRAPLDERLAVYEAEGTDVLDLSAALDDLAALDARLAERAELRLFGGLELGEIAILVGESRHGVARDWDAARRWIARRMVRGSAS